MAGIVAGAFDFPKKGNTPQRRISGIAPLAKLHIYKVLNDKGEGDDAWIIKALDHIASINEKAGGPHIAGVNLSLGGEFEQGVFGCGHTPVCEELRRLWQQGVVVVLAAGNEGFRRLISDEGEFSATMPCSIGDPANLEEAIAVGAVHKEKPHTYGISHFSSRGPTADGRKSLTASRRANRSCPAATIPGTPQTRRNGSVLQARWHEHGGADGLGRHRLFPVAPS